MSTESDAVGNGSELQLTPKEPGVGQVPFTGKISQGKQGRNMKPMKLKGGKPKSKRSKTAAGSPRKAWFEISLTDNGLEVIYSKANGREIIDCLENDDILNAQVVAAVQRIHASNQAISPSKKLNATSESGDIHIGFMLEGISDAGLTLEIFLRALGVPDPLEMQEYSVPDVIEMMPDAIGYDSSTIENLEHGDLGAVIQIRQGGRYKKKNWSENCGYLHMTFHGIELEPMAVSDFGNFLHALIHHGEEVALATLRFIYENAR